MDASPDPIGLILFYIALLFFSAYFSCAETALSASNRIRILSLADDGDRRAVRVQKLLSGFDRTLTAILIGSNLTQIGCATLATVIATRYWGEGATGIAAAITTVAVFLLAETIPKSYAKSKPEPVAMALAPSLVFLLRLLKPLSYVFSRMAELAKKPLKSSETEVTVTQDELHDILDTAAQEGALEEEEAELAQSALAFDTIPVAQIFTPWDKMVCVPQDMSPPQIAELILSCHYSRLPVVDADGNALGVLQIRKYLKTYLARKGHVSLKKTMDKAHFVTADMPIDELLTRMSAGKTHIAIVRDAAGEQLGAVTIEDILEELVGEIYDEDDSTIHGEDNERAIRNDDDGGLGV